MECTIKSFGVLDGPLVVKRSNFQSETVGRSHYKTPRANE